MALRAAAILPVTMLPAGMPNSSPRATRTAGATWTQVLTSGLAMSRRILPVWSTSERAPTGQTATHWPQNTQLVSTSSLPKAVFTTAGKPLSTAPMAPTLWYSWHTLSQRRHMMHLLASRTIEGESSMGYWDCWPLKGISRIPMSAARAWSSHLPLLGHWRQSLGWSESMSSRTVLRALRARKELVFTTMSGMHSVMQAGARFLRPTTSTTQMRHPPGRFLRARPSSSKWQRVGILIPICSAALRMVVPLGTSTSLLSIVNLIVSIFFSSVS